MEKDDKTTAKQLVAELQSAGKTVSKTTVLKGRQMLGWTTRGSAYCQMICVVNRKKCLRWATENLNANFDDVIWTDETNSSTGDPSLILLS